MKAVLQYVSGSSFFHRLHPVTKIIWAVLTGVLCFIRQDILFLAAITVINLIVFFSSGLLKEGKPVLKMFGFISALLLFFTIFFNRGGTVALTYGATFILVDEGVAQGLLMVFRMLGALLPMGIMIMLTPANDLVAAFVRYFRVPYKYAFAVTATLRFIPMLTDEMGKIIQAQTARGCSLDKGSPIKKFRRVVPLTVPLLSSSVKKMEQMAISLEVRGFGAGKRSSYRKTRFGARDIAVLAALLAGYAVGIFIIN
jgi:energy-coupling factor transport system permease protein